MVLNILFAWVWFLVGLLSGVGQGLFFHREEWLGGYGSWRRRLLRLGHISYFGTGLLNLLAAISAKLWLPAADGPLLMAASVLLVVGAVAMPVVCYMSAWKEPFRRLFFIPVAGLIGGVGCFLVVLVQNISWPTA